MAIVRLWAFILFFAVSSCAANRIRSSYQIYPVRAPSAATSFAKIGKGNAQIVASSYRDESHAPIRLTASDGTGLELRKLRVRTVVDGPLAFTELKMSFKNARKREIEGRFEITLPESASVARLAMKMGDRWQDAEVVSRRRGQEVYESYLHKQVDPILLEASVGNRFRARVYPIAAMADKEIIISYSEELPASGDYRLLLQGLPMMDKLDVDVHHGAQRERFVKRNFVSANNLVVQTKSASGVAIRSGELVMMRWVPGQERAKEVPTKINVLIDSSASAAGVYGTQVRALESLAGMLAKTYGDSLQLEVASFDNEVNAIFSGPAAQYGLAQSEALLAHGAMGASNLEAALGWSVAKGERLLLISDGIASTGLRDWQDLDLAFGEQGPRRIDVLSFGAAKDGELLHSLTQRSGQGGGVILSPSQSALQWAQQLGEAAPVEVSIDVAGASWVWPKVVRSPRAGEAVTAFAKFETQGAARLKSIALLRRVGETEISPLELPVHEGEKELVKRRWAQVQLQLLAALQRVDPLAERDKNIERISHRFRILTPSTAFLMLESERDYSRFGIDRSESGNVLTIDATGLRRVRQGSLVARDREWKNLVDKPFAASPAKAGLVPASKKSGGHEIAVSTVTPTEARMQGKITLKNTGESLAGVTVLATEGSSEKRYTAVTDGSGHFEIHGLRVGRYDLLLLYGDAKIEYKDIEIRSGKTTQIRAQMELAEGYEIAEWRESKTVETITTTVGLSLETQEIQNIPIAGRSFESALGVAAGSSAGATSVSMSGSTTFENTYIVDGAKPQRAKSKRTGRKRPDIRRFRKIRALLRQENLGRALGEALRWYAASPTNMLAIAALGEALQANAHYRLAARAYASILDLYPSRADMHRVASGYLSLLGDPAAHLRLDALRFANKARPDHAHGLRLLAIELAKGENEEEAIALLLAALSPEEDRLGRYSQMVELIRHDIGVIAAAWLARQANKGRQIKEMLDASSVMVPMEARHYAVLTWESDVARLKLGVKGTTQKPVPGRRIEIGDIGYGPEAFLLEGDLDAKTRLSVEFADQAMMGYAFAHLQVIGLDADGKLTVESRPFVALEEHELVAMGGF